MGCEELKFNLPLYADDGLSDSERMVIENHLPSCPLCRQALSEYRSLRTELGDIGVVEIPLDLKGAIKAELAESLDLRTTFTFGQSREETFKERFYHWLMPYSIGTVAASIFMLAFLFVLMSELQSSINVLETRGNSATEVFLANSNAEEIRNDMQLPPEFGDVPIAVSPPELNPAGALVALTRSIVRGDMKDEEVVIVADVFGNGLARIAGIVDPPQDDEAMRELQRAFETEPKTAPFKPSEVKNEAGLVRVVLKIQRVDVADSIK